MSMGGFEPPHTENISVLVSKSDIPMCRRFIGSTSTLRRIYIPCSDLIRTSSGYLTVSNCGINVNILLNIKSAVQISVYFVLISGKAINWT